MHTPDAGTGSRVPGWLVTVRLMGGWWWVAVPHVVLRLGVAERRGLAEGRGGAAEAHLGRPERALHIRSVAARAHTQS